MSEKDNLDAPVRVNARISKQSNDWLDKKAFEMAMTKSGLINMAIENYIKEIEVVHGLPKLINQLEQQGIKLDL